MCSSDLPRANAEMMLSGLRLDARFAGRLVLGEECARAKPHPDPYLEGLRLLGLPPHGVIVVEDSPAGVRAGVAAGLPVVGLTTGQSAEALRAAGASAIAADFHGVMALLGAV